MIRRAILVGVTGRLPHTVVTPRYGQRDFGLCSRFNRWRRLRWDAKQRVWPHPATIYHTSEDDGGTGCSVSLRNIWRMFRFRAAPEGALERSMEVECNRKNSAGYLPFVGTIPQDKNKIRRLVLISHSSVTRASSWPDRPATSQPPFPLLSCADEPAAPDPPPRAFQDQRDVMALEYILGLRSAWGSCKAAVAGVKAWVDELERK